MRRAHLGTSMAAPVAGVAMVASQDVVAAVVRLVPAVVVELAGAQASRVVRQPLVATAAEAVTASTLDSLAAL
ncbi:hypothetical protein A5715_07145 [Mycolicibacter heraklionensis]|nr:hypothetical protein A5715_07145 [Mycolicibacter heraklionensis]